MSAAAKLLVVDDEQVVCDSCTRIFARQGYSVETSTDSHKGLEMASENDYAAILLDFKMPVMDGIEFLEALRKTKPNVPVIMITGYSTVPSAASAMRMGASDYIPKPFTPEEITSAVHRVVSLPGAQRTAPADTRVASTTSVDAVEKSGPPQAVTSAKPAPKVLDPSAILSMIHAAMASDLEPATPQPVYLPESLHRVSFTTGEGYSISLLAPGAGLSSKKGAGYRLVQDLLRRGFPVQVDYGRRQFSITEFLAEFESYDGVFVLNAEKTGSPEFVAASPEMSSRFPLYPQVG